MTQHQALQILKTGASVFITGEPGSGKTYTINQYVRYLRQTNINVAITASTGIAATHIGGTTIHSWSGLGIRKTISDMDLDRLATKEYLVRRLQRPSVLIIDEISMLDAATLDSVDRICREVRRREEPFGGLQVILVGDFFQLPPVSKTNEPPSRFAFTSKAWHQLNPLVCYLTEQHRQEDSTLLDILSSLRRNAITDTHRRHLDARQQTPAAGQQATITQLFSHNADVDHINHQHLQTIPGPSKTFRMATTGRKNLVDQLQRGCLSPAQLTLKEGAVVMFTKNHPKGLFVNGTLGKIVAFDEQTKCPIIATKSGSRLVAEPMDWTIEDNGRILAKISQIPLRLAWAITVHKSQGVSLDAAAIDLRSAFVAGQGYVALSRVRSLKGLFLTGYNQQALTINSDILAKDEVFRQQSTEAAQAFAAIPDKELTTMHANFIRANGGTLQMSKRSTEPKQAYQVDIIRQQSPNAYRSWTEQEESALLKHSKAGKSVQDIAALLGRRPGAIRSRLKKLNISDNASK